MPKKAAKKKGKAKPKSKSKMSLTKPVKNSSSQFKFNIMCRQVLSNGTAAPVSQSLYFPLHSPTYQINAAGNWTQFAAADIPTEYSKLLITFSEYVVDSLELRYVPNYVDVGSSPTTAGALEIPNLMYVWNERSDPSIAATEVIMLNNGIIPRKTNSANTIKFKIYNPKTNRMKWRRIQSIGTDPGAAITSNVAALTDGITDTWQGIRVFFPNVDTQIFFGRLYLKWQIRFRNPRNSAAI